jgi:ABC-type sugar transport system substrate-binding protein
MSWRKQSFGWIAAVVLAVALVLSGCTDRKVGEAGSPSSPSPSGAAATVAKAAGSAAAYQWGDANFEQFVRKAAEGKTLKIGFTPPAASEFYDIIEHGAFTMINEISDRFGVKVQFEMAAPSEHQAVESQVATIENWTAKKFDAILVSSAGDFDAMNAVYQKAMDAGTMIYMFNMPAEMWKESDLKAVSVISYNNHYQAGYLVGKYAAEKLHGKGKILLVWGLPGHWSTSRKDGFLEAIKEYPDMQIVGEQRGDYVRDKGMQAAENLLQAHPDVNLIYGENEEMALGAVQAVENRGLKTWDGKDGIMVIGADGLKSGYDSIRAGKLTATVNVGPVDMGREFVKAVFLHQVLGYSVDKIINVPTVIVDKSNVDISEAYSEWALGTKMK